VECGPCPDFASNTLEFALQLRKITEKLSPGNRMGLGCSAPNAIRLVDLAIAADAFDWPAAPCRPWLSRQATVSTLGQLKYLPSCTREFPSSAKFESKLSVRALMCFLQTAERPDPRVCACYLRTKGHQQRGEDTWIVAHITYGHGREQRTSMRGTHSPPGAG